MRINDIQVGFDRDIVITLKIPLKEREELKPILSTIETFSPEIDYVLSLARAKKPRSMDANAYMWVLCDKIASVVKSTKEEIYRKAIKEVGVFADVAVQEGEACAELISSWGSNGIGYFSEMFNSSLFDKNGKPMKRVRLYKGSHTYTQPELSRVIDSLVDEAKALNIETLTPNQIKELEESWKG